MMDLAIILDGWPYDERNESNNVRKIVGVDGRMKVQIRMRTGVVQWEVDGRPDGTRPHGFESMLAYCRHAAATGGSAPAFALDPALTDSLLEEMRDCARRRHAFMLLGDYQRALGDALHGLAALDMIRDHAGAKASALRHEGRRPHLLVDRARAEALLEIQRERPGEAVAALTRGVQDIEAFYRANGLSSGMLRCSERRLLIDFRRSLRERYHIRLTDAELLQALQVEQQVAVEQEDYEMAARLRDKIHLLQSRIDKTE